MTTTATPATITDAQTGRVLDALAATGMVRDYSKVSKERLTAVLDALRASVNGNGYTSITNPELAEEACGNRQKVRSVQYALRALRASGQIRQQSYQPTADMSVSRRIYVND